MVLSVCLCVWLTWSAVDKGEQVEIERPWNRWIIKSHFVDSKNKVESTG